MKFYGIPNSLVKERVKKKFSTEIKMKPLFRFDENGEFETEDEKLIEKLKRKFEYSEELIEKKLKHCKKCDFETENMGDLLSHYKQHKKN